MARCSDNGKRGDYSGESGKDGVWLITKTAGNSPRLVASFNNIEMINILMSDSTCDYPDWQRYWSQDVAKLEFSSKDSASVQYRMGKQKYMV